MSAPYAPGDTARVLYLGKHGTSLADATVVTCEPQQGRPRRFRLTVQPPSDARATDETLTYFIGADGESDFVSRPTA